jgi:two-component system chemotaxis sensor kinase CheA
MILAMEGGAPESHAAFKRRLHTMKGEAGVLGLDDFERVCHATEDLVASREITPELTDRLLRIRDWMARALEAYAMLCRPEPSGEEFVASALALAAPGQARLERDAETVGLFGEFLTESAEGLTRVEQILMEVERGGGEADSVNGLFRVFHTVKGTAGFLDLTDVVALAHETETMLNLCREGALPLRGPVVDLVFDATSALRELLAAVRAAVEAGCAVAARPPGLDALLAGIRAASEQAAPQQAAPAGAGPGSPPRLDGPPPEAPSTAAPPSPPPAPDAPRAASTEAQEQRASAPAERDGAVRLRETIKVDLERVDSLVEMIGELVVVESMVVNAPEIVSTSSVRVRNCLAQLAKVTRDLQDVGMHMRMVPVAGVFQKMARLVRDLSRKSAKQVRFVMSGESTEIDRSMVEQIADPLVHMIRNAVDHGLEPAEARLAAGKPAAGTIRLGAYHEGGSVVIEIADDGRGLDRAAIVAKAVERGLIGSDEGMTEAEIYALIFAPGFSTAAQVTELSGRGVGMDVVKRNIEALRGRVLISSRPGAGTTFKIVLPLTLAIIDGMLIACGQERYIIPTLSIVESIQPDPKMLVSLARSNEMINLRGEILPLVRLDRLFRLEGAKSDPTEALVVVVEGVGRRIGLLVDEVVTQQQVVIKSLGEALPRTRFISGAAILSDGRVGLILNVEEIATLMQRTRESCHAPPAAPREGSASSPEVRA